MSELQDAIALAESGRPVDEFTTDEVLLLLRLYSTGDSSKLSPEDELESEEHVWWGEFSGRGTDVEGLGAVTEVDSGGGMDEGSNLFTVLEIGTRFFRKSGYYASHDGSYWDGSFKQVRPREKLITVYE